MKFFLKTHATKNRTKVCRQQKISIIIAKNSSNSTKIAEENCETQITLIKSAFDQANAQSKKKAFDET